MQEQPGASAAAGPFAKIRLLQPGEDGKFFVVAVFCHDALLTPCPCPSLPTTSRQRSESGNRRPLVSRSWYTRDTASLVCWLRPWQGKCCLIVVSLTNLAHVPPVPACPSSPANTAAAEAAGRWLAAGARIRYGHQSWMSRRQTLLIVVFDVQPCLRPTPVSLASWLRSWM